MEKYNIRFKSFFVITIILAGVSAMLYFGYLMACSIDLCDTRGQLSNRKLISKPISTNPETGWNIFIDPETDLTFEYPSNYIVKNETVTDPNALSHITIKNVETAENYSLDTYFSVSIEIYRVFVTPGSHIPMYVAKPICDAENEFSIQTREKSIDELACRNRITSSFKPFTADNIRGSSTPYFFFESSSVYYAFDIDPYFVKVVQWGAEGTTPSEGSTKTLYQIISTFKINR